MGIAQKILPHYTYDDWLHWEGRWELIEGHPIAMSPMPVPKHQRIAAALIMEIGISLKKCKHCNVYDPIDFKIADDTILQPDIVVVCGEITKPYLDFPPALVVEILSPSTALRDRHTKFEIYQQQAIKYYLIVDTDKETIEIYKMVNAAYQLQSVNSEGLFEFAFEDDCIITPEIKNIW
ncbi:MAG: Uma2 family endonuclease [Panacibacter sp.]